MVLKLKMTALILFFYFAGTQAYAQYLHVHDISEEAANDLEWTVYRINMVLEEGEETKRPPGFSQWFYYSREKFQEFTLYNNGNTPHIVKFGVFYQYPEDVQRDFLFEINGVAVDHQFLVGELYRLYGIEVGNGYYAFYDVVFPPHESVVIKVYNLFGSISRFFPNGTPQFTAMISNRRLDAVRPYFEIEESWIRDILFTRQVGTIMRGASGVSLVSILEQEGALDNAFFTLQKTNGNSWEIEFSNHFVEKYRGILELEIEDGIWGWNEHGGWLFNIEDAMTPYQHIFLTNRQLRVLRNAIYARHGFIFRDEGMQRMFEDIRSSTFGNINYQPNPDFTEAMLTDIDRANIATIQRLEVLAGD